MWYNPNSSAVVRSSDQDDNEGWVRMREFGAFLFGNGVAPGHVRPQEARAAALELAFGSFGARDERHHTGGAGALRTRMGPRGLL